MKDTQEIIKEIENRITLIEEYTTNFIQNQPSITPPSYTIDEAKKLNYVEELRDLLNWIKN